ncbi:MazG family protein [Gordonia sp. (in: high G+C Gram-positive bacteria)]|uniref:MazG family protein n=1 Tax=Gordonia sp. (in: high G+C Gram-positive bacteria) TaxID=84139 RepID=UPI0016947A83|nr:MazG family protein [Gordonia sp. (in: high G+C Gram-positive bacteria)]NLG45138.1 MazG family protein [Gordonia sp. (in: high G+C Gram-positive bacteria)]
MAVVLLDGSRPDLIPAGAVALLVETVAVTEEVHPSLLWQLPSYVLVGFVGDDRSKTLVTSNREHPAVVERLKWGETLVEGGHMPGANLLRAVELMDRLRRLGPWERLQTHDSLRRYLLEEVYELLDAIERGTPEELQSELGDLLLQVLFHARIAADSATGSFDIDDVAQSFIDKVSARTPGVLGGEHADLARQIDEWEAAKSAERDRGSVLDGIVTTQPALALVQKVFERLASVSFPVIAVSPSLYRVDIPFRKHATTSVEDDLRRRVMGLMDEVRAAEAAAGDDGVTLNDENTWRKYLGMAYEEEAAVDEDVVADDDATGEEPALNGQAVDDDLDEEYDETIVDSDPIALNKKGKTSKFKELTFSDVPGMVVLEKWSAEGE